MRWVSKPPPKDHDRRIVCKFAMIPTRMVDSGFTIWFQRYFLCQDRLQSDDYGVGFWCDKGCVEDKSIAIIWRDKEYHRLSSDYHESVVKCLDRINNAN